MLDEQGRNFNDEARMVRAGLALNDEGSPNVQMTQRSGARVRRTIGTLLFRHSDFVIPSSFVIRHSSFNRIVRDLPLSVHLSDFPHGQD
jgi:hypothetical protein